MPPRTSSRTNTRKRLMLNGCGASSKSNPMPHQTRLPNVHNEREKRRKKKPRMISETEFYSQGKEFYKDFAIRNSKNETARRIEDKRNSLISKSGEGTLKKSFEKKSPPTAQDFSNH